MNTVKAEIEEMISLLPGRLDLVVARSPGACTCSRYEERGVVVHVHHLANQPYVSPEHQIIHDIFFKIVGEQALIDDAMEHNMKAPEAAGLDSDTFSFQLLELAYKQVKVNLEVVEAPFDEADWYKAEATVHSTLPSLDGQVYELEGYYGDVKQYLHALAGDKHNPEF